MSMCSLPWTLPRSCPTSAADSKTSANFTCRSVDVANAAEVVTSSDAHRSAIGLEAPREELKGCVCPTAVSQGVIGVGGGRCLDEGVRPPAVPNLAARCDELEARVRKQQDIIESLERRLESPERLNPSGSVSIADTRPRNVVEPQTAHTTVETTTEARVYTTPEPLSSGNALAAAAWLALMSFTFTLAPGVAGCESDNALVDALTSQLYPRPEGIDELLYLTWNTFSLLPAILASLTMPQGKRGQRLPAAPFFLAAPALGFFTLGPYFALRSRRLAPLEKEDLGWFSRNVFERRAFGAVLVALILSIPSSSGLLAPEFNWSISAAAFGELCSSSRFVSVAVVDQCILAALAAYLVYEDAQRRGWQDKAVTLGVASLLLPLLGPAAYLAARPPAVDVTSPPSMQCPVGQMQRVGQDMGKGVRRWTRRLYTRQDRLNLHKLSGLWLITAGVPCAVMSLAAGFQASPLPAPMDTNTALLQSVLLAGALNGLTGIPMAGFQRIKTLDFSSMQTIRPLGWLLQGTGMTTMHLWVTWWFSGAYPEQWHRFDALAVGFWALVIVGSTVQEEAQLQLELARFGDQNGDAAGRSELAGAGAGTKAGAADGDLDYWTTIVLFRLGSWPNLTQLPFLYSIACGSTVWLTTVSEAYPKQELMLFHFGLVSALGYAISIFAETLRARRLIDLRTDLIILTCCFTFPMFAVFLDALAYGSQVTINPLEYWLIFALPWM